MYGVVWKGVFICTVLWKVRRGVCYTGYCAAQWAVPLLDNITIVPG